MISAVEVKRILTEYMDTEREIDNEIERLESLENRIYSVGSPEISDMPRNPSPSNDRVVSLVIRKNELEERVKELVENQYKRRKIYEDAIEKIQLPDQRAVIRMRYIDCAKWDAVNKMIFGADKEFDEKRDSYMRRIMILHGQALQQLAEIL